MICQSAATGIGVLAQPDLRRPLQELAFRGRHKSAVGSGLSLAIASQALEQAGARMTLRNRTDDPGLRVEIVSETPQA